MVQLNRVEVKNLLALIKDPEDRKTVQAYLQLIQQITAGKVASASEKKRIAKEALDLINRIGFELGKHAILGAVLNALLKLLHEWHMFD